MHLRKLARVPLRPAVGALLLAVAMWIAAGATDAGAQGPVSLNPPFEPLILNYTATVPHDVTEVTFDLRAQNPRATVTVNGGDPATPVQLAVGENTIKIVVTAEDTRYTRTYTIVVTRLEATGEDTAGVTVSHTSRSVRAGSTTTYTVVLDSEPTADVVIAATSGTTARARVAPASRTFTSSNWDTPQSFTIRGVAVGRSTITHAATSTDSDYDGATIASVTAAVSAAPRTFQPAPPRTFRIESTKTVNEGASARLTVTLGRAAPAGGLALAFNYDYTGSTATTADTGTTPLTLTIAPGQTTGTLTVPITNDALVEGSETFTVTVSTAVSGWSLVSGQGLATVTITDDDAGEARIGFGTAGRTTEHTISVAENVSGGTLTVPVAISHNPENATTFTIEVLTAGTATGADYSIATKAVTFSSTGNRTQDLSVAITNDALVEEDQTIKLRIAAADSPVNDLGDHYARHAMGRLSTVTITDDDAGEGTIAFGDSATATSAYTTTVNEDVPGGSLSVPVTISSLPAAETTFAVRVLSGGTATVGTACLDGDGDATGADYVFATRSVTFGGTHTSTTRNLAITVCDDGDVEPDETIRLGFAPVRTPARAILDRYQRRPAGNLQAVITIDSEDAPSSVRLEASGGVTVRLRLAAGAGTTAAADEYALPGPFTIPAGQLSATGVVRLLDDDEVDGLKHLRLTGTTSPALTLLWGGSVQYMDIPIRDTDSPSVTVSDSSLTVTAGQTAPYTVRLNTRPAATVTVTAASDDETLATVSPATLTFTTQNWRAPQTVRVRAVAEGVATITHTVSSADPTSAAASAASLTVTVSAPQRTAGPSGGSTGGSPGGGGGGGGGPTPSDADFEWTVKRDIEALDSGHDRPAGAHGEGETLWLLHNGSGANDAVYAYDLASGERVQEREFPLDERNRAPRGLWSGAEGVAWVSDSGQDRLFAYDLATGERLPERDIELHERNADARGIWSDGQTLWVLDDRRAALYAYALASGDLLAGYALASRNGDPHGIWSDGVTIWISDHGLKQLWAYRLPALPETAALVDDPPPLERVPDEDFTELSKASNNSPRGIWSDGAFMYVADESDGKVYTYNMPDAIDARLVSLAIEGVDFGEFDPAASDYAGVVAEGVSQVTVEAGAAQRRTTVVVDPPDADEAAAGHQVALEGLSQITVTVTSADGSRTRVYRVAFDVPEQPWAHCLKGAVAEGFSLLVYEGGSVDDLVACAESRGIAALYVLHEGRYVGHFPGAPDFVNERFATLYPEGVPALTPLVAASDGPPSEDPVGEVAWPEGAACFHGEVEPGATYTVSVRARNAGGLGPEVTAQITLITDEGQ